MSSMALTHKTSVSANNDGGNCGGSSRAAAAANGNMANDIIAVFISANIIPKKFLLCLAAESFLSRRPSLQYLLFCECAARDFGGAVYNTD